MTTTDIFCGSAGRALASGDTSTRVILTGPGANAKLNLEHICKPLLTSMPRKFHDLIEIACYVYVADQLTDRQGRRDGSDHGRLWRRSFHFRVPVREPDFWNTTEVMDTLVSTLGFLSDDTYTFSFTKDPEPTPIQTYFPFPDHQSWGTVDDVVLFSGGLDSLSGALEQILRHQQRLILVTHAPCSKYEAWHKLLREQITQRAGDKAPFFIKVAASKQDEEPAEFTQRSRSFLYASLATTVANVVGKSRIRFFENGVTSLNLPINGQIIGARATRTTHPETLRRFAKLFSLIVGVDFQVENPYQWRTKADIIRQIVELKCQGMIENATSCAHSWIQPRKTSHCGTCSQCVDRRLAAIAAGATDYDHEHLYKTNLFTDALRDRKTTRDRTLVGSYAQTAMRWAKMTEVELLISEGELGQILAALPGSPSQNATNVIKLIHRHAREVQGAITSGIAMHSAAMVARAIDADSFIHMVVGLERGEVDPKAATDPTSTAESTVTNACPNWFKPDGKRVFVKLGSDGPHPVANLAGMQILRCVIAQPDTPITCQALARILYEQHAHLLKRREGALQRQVTIIDEHDREVAAWEAAYGEVAQDADTIVDAEAGVEVTDMETIRSVREEIDNLKQELKSNPSSRRRETIEREIATAEAYLRKATRPGRPEESKRVNQARVKLEQAIARNLKTALKELHRASPALARFFDTPKKGGHVATGYQICFAPPAEAREWDIAETTLAKLFQHGAVAT